MHEITYKCGLDKAPHRVEKTEIVEDKYASQLQVIFRGRNREDAWQDWVKTRYPSCNYKKGSGSFSCKKIK